MVKAQCCDMKGLLSFLILLLLSKRALTGQQIIKEIGKRKGHNPSPGTIYPALKNLSTQKLIKEKKSGKEIIYSLTSEGKASFQLSKKIFNKTFKGI